MSIYNWLPTPTSSQETLYAWWENGFSKEEITQIITIGESKTLTDATVGNNENNPEIRRTKVSWLSYQDLPWLYDRMGYIGRMLNSQFFRYDISGFSEDFQYTKYEGKEEGYYDWHMDTGYSTNGSPARKLTMVLFLSSPDEYEGGEFQFRTGNEIQTAKKDQGLIHAFPGFILHKVTPVTRGVRRSLVVWSCGPAWK